MGSSALGSNRPGGPGLWHSGICEAILEATRLTYEGANLTSATGRPRAAHTASSKRRQFGPHWATLRARQVSDDMTGGWRAGVRGNQTAVGNLDERRSDLCARLLHSMSLPASLITDEPP